MTWLGLMIFLGGVFATRMFGGFGLGALIGDSETWTRLLTLLPLAIVSSVVAVQVATTGRDVVLDARVVGVGLAAILAWRRVPLALVVMAAAAATALTRAAGWG